MPTQTAPDDVFKGMAIAIFIDGSHESDRKHAVKLAHFRTLNEVLTQTEAIKQAVREVSTCRLATDVSKGRVYSWSHLGEKKLERGLLMAMMLSLTGKDIPVRLMNVNYYPVTLK